LSSACNKRGTLGENTYSLATLGLDSDLEVAREVEVALELSEGGALLRGLESEADGLGA